MAENNIPTTAADAGGSSYVAWSAIFAGVFIAVAISLVLSTFGGAVGLTADTALRADGGASWSVLVGGLWVALVAIASSTAGGYIAGRMRTRWNDAAAVEVEFRDGAHGLAVWATATVMILFMSGLTSALGAIAAAAAAASDAPAQANPEFAARMSANVSTIGAFSVAAGAAIGAAAAWFAAALGGQHRDESVSVDMIAPVAVRRSRV